MTTAVVILSIAIVILLLFIGLLIGKNFELHEKSREADYRADTAFKSRDQAWADRNEARDKLNRIQAAAAEVANAGDD